MREIKFRVWCETDKGNEMVYFLPMKLDNGLWFESLETHIDQHISDPMQFIGLKDKNKVDIYEGDILHFKTYEGGGFGKIGIDCYAQVVFGEHNLTNDSLYRSQGFYLLTGKSHHETSIHYWLKSHKACVIGNIHQNKELIK